MTHRRRILFFAEAVTLAHVVRPVVLARSLDSTVYDVHFACDVRYHKLLGERAFTGHPLGTISSDRFLDRLYKGSPLYDTDTLRTYVSNDLDIIEQVQPDVVIGDFRLSLAVSATLAHVPYLSIANAYWSPFFRQRFPVPDISLTKVLGVTLGQMLFNTIRPMAFAYHTLPLNRIRRENRLSSIGLDLRQVYTHADYTIYADIPELIPTINVPAHHHYIGPILWSPAVPLPDWWNELPENKPIIYVTLGSSGNTRLLPMVLDALADLPVVVIVATAGRIKLENIARNVFAAEYLPGVKAAARASLIICNGGSLTAYQALAEGKPVIGIAGNLDQYLNMSMIEKAGVGRLLRSGKVSTAVIRTISEIILKDAEMKRRAQAFMHIMSKYSAGKRFTTLLEHILGGQHGLDD